MIKEMNNDELMEIRGGMSIINIIGVAYYTFKLVKGILKKVVLR